MDVLKIGTSFSSRSKSFYFQVLLSQGRTLLNELVHNSLLILIHIVFDETEIARSMA